MKVVALVGLSLSLGLLGVSFHARAIALELRRLRKLLELPR